MQIGDFEGRHQTRYYDHEKVPSKELIEKVLHKAHDLVPSKQKLMPYVVKILGPEHKKIKMDMYELASEVEYPDLNLRNKYRLDLVRQYEHNNVIYNHRWPHGNSQLFAPYILLLVPTKPVPNAKLSETYGKDTGIGLRTRGAYVHDEIYIGSRERGVVEEKELPYPPHDVRPGTNLGESLQTLIQNGLDFYYDGSHYNLTDTGGLDVSGNEFLPSGL